MNKNFTLFILLSFFSLQLCAQRLLTEDFNYASGDLTSANSGTDVSGGAWVGFSGTGFNIKVSDGSLSYTNYVTSPSVDSRKISLVSTSSSAEDAYTSFTVQTANTVYTSFLLSVDSTGNLAPDTSSKGEYFAAFLPSTSTSNYVGRVIIRKGSAANTFNLGILIQTTSGITAGWSSANYTPGTTYLVTVGYEFISGANNDVAKLWVNPPVSATEPVADATSTFVAGTEPADIGRLAFRQASKSTPSCDIDAIKVSTSWADGTLPLKLSSFSANIANGRVNLAWTTESEINVKEFVIERSTNASSFTAIAHVAAQNGGKSNKYTYSEPQTLSGSAWYRLKIVDQNGSITYSDAKMLSAKDIVKLVIKGNLVKDNLIVAHKQATNGTYIQIVSANGSVISKKQITEGATETSVNVSALAAGNYFVVFVNGKDKETARFIKY